MDDAAVEQGDAELTGAADAATAEGDVTLSAEDATELVVATIQAHADSLLRLARRHSLCADDAYDAYQRAMEIFIRRACTLDPARATGWIHVVVKHEALAVRQARLRLVGGAEVDFDAHEAHDVPSPEDRLLRFEHVTRSAEALARLKPQEVRALWLKAAGSSYAQIAQETGWSYTKVNRCITEGRRSFLARYASIESGAECERWAPVVSAMIDGEATHDQIAAARPHLRNCPACRAMARDAHRHTAALRALFPVAAAGAAHPSSPSDPGSLLVRIYEAIAGALHERVASSVVKAQAVLDAASAGKVAAVAASAAALAGGGIAAVETTVSRQPRPPRHAVARHATRPTPRHSTGTVRPSAHRFPASGGAPVVEREFEPRPTGQQVATEFGSSTSSAHAAAVPTSAPTARASSAAPDTRTAASSAQVSREFAP